MKNPTYDGFKDLPSIETFHFRNLHPKILLGTASDRYAGWIGQIYTREPMTGLSFGIPTITAGRPLQSTIVTLVKVAAPGCFCTSDGLKSNSIPMIRTASNGK
jgi:hypothetical protein